jgi:hypothetical protein
VQELLHRAQHSTISARQVRAAFGERDVVPISASASLPARYGTIRGRGPPSRDGVPDARGGGPLRREGDRSSGDAIPAAAGALERQERLEDRARIVQLARARERARRELHGLGLVSRVVGEEGPETRPQASSRERGLGRLGGERVLEHGATRLLHLGHRRLRDGRVREGGLRQAAGIAELSRHSGGRAERLAGRRWSRAEVARARAPAADRSGARGDRTQPRHACRNGRLPLRTQPDASPSPANRAHRSAAPRRHAAW